MSLPRIEYRNLELPRVEARPTPRGLASKAIWGLAVIAVAGVLWLSPASRGLVFAREWVGQRLGGAGSSPGDGTADAAGLLLHTVQPIDLRITSLVSGTLESASSATVRSEVEGEVAILTVLPEGTRVVAGDVVVELDSSVLRGRETEQQIVVENVRAAVNQLEQADLIAKSQADGNLAGARLVVEFARLDLEKYEKSDYPLELRQLQIESALAQEELERAKVQLTLSEDLAKDGYIHQGELEVDRSRVTQANFKVENAHGKERSLRDYTYPRRKRDLESKLQEAERALARVETQERIASEQAEASIKAKKKTLDLEETKLSKIRDQLVKCAIRAPQAGIVIYPVPPDTDMIEAFIKQGNRVKERQHVFSIPDTEVLQITASLHEANVNRIRPGMPAKITIDSVPDLELSGAVQWVSPTPEPGDWRRTAVKFYESKVSIDLAPEGLRPGMSAKALILMEALPDTLAVPVQSVVQRGSQGVCYVVGAQPELRRLRLGKSSSEFVQVLEGLSAGERVALSPDVLGIPADAFAEPPSPDAPAAVAVAQSAPPAGTDMALPDGAAVAGVEPVRTEIEYEAVLTGVPVTKAEVEFKIKTKDGVPAYKFQCEVVGGPAGATYEIRVDGVRVGSVTLDDTGSCALELSSKLSNFPAEFPLYAGPGTEVELGTDLKGTLAPEAP